MREVEGQKMDHFFCGRYKYMTPKWFKSTTNSIISGSSFFLTSSQTKGTENNPQRPSHQPQSSLSPNPLMAKPK